MIILCRHNDTYLSKSKVSRIGVHGLGFIKLFVCFFINSTVLTSGLVLPTAILNTTTNPDPIFLYITTRKWLVDIIRQEAVNQRIVPETLEET